MSPQKKVEHGLSFLEFKNRVALNQPISTERNIPILKLRFHIPSQAKTVSIRSQEIQPMTSQYIVVYEQNGALFGKFTAALGCVYFNVFKHKCSVIGQ